MREIQRQERADEEEVGTVQEICPVTRRGTRTGEDTSSGERVIPIPPRPQAVGPPGDTRVSGEVAGPRVDPYGNEIRDPPRGLRRIRKVHIGLVGDRLATTQQENGQRVCAYKGIKYFGMEVPVCLRLKCTK